MIDIKIPPVILNLFASISLYHTFFCPSNLGRRQFLAPNISIEELAENEEEPADDDFFDKVLDDISQQELRERIHTVLSTLTEKEQKVISMRYGFDDGKEKTLEEVGIEFNVTRERIRQIESKALKKLRHPSRTKRLQWFFNDIIKASETLEKDKQNSQILKKQH